MVLQALTRAKAIDERDPEYHLQLTKFADLGECSLVLYLKTWEWPKSCVICLCQ